MEISSISSSGSGVADTSDASIKSKIAALNRQIAEIESIGLDKDTVQSQTAQIRTEIAGLESRLSGANNARNATEGTPESRVSSSGSNAASAAATGASGNRTGTQTSLYQWYA
jgi:hypothetical protein